MAVRLIQKYTTVRSQMLIEPRYPHEFIAKGWALASLHLLNQCYLLSRTTLNHLCYTPKLGIYPKNASKVVIFWWRDWPTSMSAGGAEEIADIQRSIWSPSLLRATVYYQVCLVWIVSEVWTATPTLQEILSAKMVSNWMLASRDIQFTHIPLPGV